MEFDKTHVFESSSVKSFYHICLKVDGNDKKEIRSADKVRNI